MEPTEDQIAAASDAIPVAIAPKGRAPLGYRLLYHPIRWLLLHLFRVEVNGREHLPAGNFIVAANHLSWVDAFLLLAVLPLEPRLHFIGRRSEVFKSWIRRAVFWLVGGGIIPVEPGSGRATGAERALRDALAVMAQGGSLGIFPEGRIGQEGELMPFRGGVGFLSARSGLGVVPVTLSGAKELYYGKPITLTIGEPMYLAAGPGAGARNAAFIAQLQETMAAMLPAYHAPQVAHKRLHFLTDLM